MTVTIKKRRRWEERRRSSSHGPSLSPTTTSTHSTTDPSGPAHHKGGEGNTFNHQSDHTTTHDFGQRYHCDSCAIDITRLPRMRCAACEDYDLCMECFVSGKHPSKTSSSSSSPTTSHSPHHPYRIMEYLDFPIFDPDWTADEELLLVEGLESFGMGNWEQISEHIGTKTTPQVRQHYQTVYVNSPHWPSPTPIAVHATFANIQSTRRSAHHLIPLPLVTNPKATRPPASAPVNHEIQGYMPGRSEFEYEHENDAEQVIKDMEFLPPVDGLPTEREEDMELKLALLHRYNEALDARRDRKLFIANRGMLEFKKLQAAEKKKGREERDIISRYRVFAKLMTPEDFDLFVESMLSENQLLARICQLQEYRRMGITSLKAASVYDKEKANRESTKSLALLGLDRSRVKMESNGSSPQSMSISPVKGLGPSLQISSSSSMQGLGGRKPPPALDISHADCFDLLTDKERELCSSIRVYPKAYLVIKETILREYILRSCNLSKRSCRQMIKIDVVKTSRIYDFFVEQGWIKLPPPLPSTSAANTPTSAPARKRTKTAVNPAPTRVA